MQGGLADGAGEEMPGMVKAVIGSGVGLRSSAQSAIWWSDEASFVE